MYQAAGINVFKIIGDIQVDVLKSEKENKDIFDKKAADVLNFVKNGLFNTYNT